VSQLEGACQLAVAAGRERIGRRKMKIHFCSTKVKEKQYFAHCFKINFSVYLPNKIGIELNKNKQPSKPNFM
jgi:hypothetical protein